MRTDGRTLADGRMDGRTDGWTDGRSQVKGWDGMRFSALQYNHRQHRLHLIQEANEAIHVHIDIL